MQKLFPCCLLKYVFVCQETTLFKASVLEKTKQERKLIILKTKMDFHEYSDSEIRII